MSARVEALAEADQMKGELLANVSHEHALRLKAALLFRTGIVVVNVPYHLSASTATTMPVAL